MTQIERYPARRIEWEADDNGVRGALPDGTSCYWAVTGDGDLELDEAASDHWPPTGDYEWPAPPGAVAAEALELAAASADETCTVEIIHTGTDEHVIAIIDGDGQMIATVEADGSLGDPCGGERVACIDSIDAVESITPDMARRWHDSLEVE